MFVTQQPKSQLSCHFFENLGRVEEGVDRSQEIQERHEAKILVAPKRLLIFG